MAPLASAPAVLCPNCGSDSVRRSTRRAALDRLLWLSGRAQARCRSCHCRFVAPRAALPALRRRTDPWRFLKSEREWQLWKRRQVPRLVRSALISTILLTGLALLNYLISSDKLAGV